MAFPCQSECYICFRFSFFLFLKWQFGGTWHPGRCYVFVIVLKKGHVMNFFLVKMQVHKMFCVAFHVFCVGYFVKSEQLLFPALANANLLFVLLCCIILFFLYWQICGVLNVLSFEQKFTFREYVDYLAIDTFFHSI